MSLDYSKWDAIAAAEAEEEEMEKLVMREKSRQRYVLAAFESLIGDSVALRRSKGSNLIAIVCF